MLLFKIQFLYPGIFLRYLSRHKSRHCINSASTIFSGSGISGKRRCISDVVMATDKHSAISVIIFLKVFICNVPMRRNTIGVKLHRSDLMAHNFNNDNDKM